MLREPRTRLPDRQRIPGLPVALIERLKSMPRWVFFLSAMAAIPIATIPVGGLARYTTTGPSFCVSCHATGETPDRGVRSLVHPSTEQVTCVDCHAKTGQVVFEGYARGFMAEPDRINQNCVRCHNGMTQTNEQDDFKRDFLGIRITHANHLERGATCTTCHANVAHDLEVPQTNRPRMQSCNTCHAVSDNCTKCHTAGIPTALPPVPAPSGRGEAIGDGRAYYMRVCSACHGPQGNALAKVDLSKQEVLNQLGESVIFRAVAQGHGEMPAFGQKYGGTLNDEQVRAIIGYLASEAVGQTAPDAKALYNRGCVVCHGDNGDKVAGVKHSSPEFWKSRSDSQVIRAISVGEGAMPPMSVAEGGALTNSEVRAVIDYLQQKSGFNRKQLAAGPDAERLYQQSCAGCHGANGRQVPVANLASKEFYSGVGDNRLASSIANGIGGMPAYSQAKGGKLADDEINALVSFVKGMAGLSPTPQSGSGSIDVSQGKTLYSPNCAGCHGANGAQIPSANLGSAEFLKSREADLAKATAEGKGGMPAMGKAKGGPLSDDQIASIVAYLKSLGGQ